MQSFLEEVVDHTLKSHRNLEDLIFVLPSKRAGNFLKHLLAGKVKKTLFAPDIFSIEAFVEHLSGLHYASNTELLFELYRAYLETAPEAPDTFYDFSKWGQTVLQDFNEIDRYLVAPDKLFAYLSDIKELEHWSVQPGKSELIEGYVRFWNTLEPLYTRFRKNLLKEQQGYQGLVYSEACAALDRYLEATAGKTHLFLGFNALNKAESTLIQGLLERGQAKIYWDADPYFIEDPQHDAGYFIRQHKSSWNYLATRPLEGLSNHYNSPKAIRITAVPKNVSQVKYIGALLEELQNQEGNLLENTAVVLGDESLLNPLLHSIPKEIGSVNITMGYPLKHSPLQGMFSHFFELYLHQSSRGWFYRNALSLLSHPYIEQLLLDGQSNYSEKLRALIKEKNWIHLTTRMLLLVPGIPHVPFDALFFNESPSPQPFIAHCTDIILLLKSKFQEQSDPLVLEQLYQFYALFNQLDDYVTRYPFIQDLKTLHSLYQTLLSLETVDFRGEPLEGLQVMGMLESRNLDFETVIISSVNEGILPSGKTNTSFIPYDLKKQFGLPTYKEKDAVYAYHFYRLLQRAKRVYLLYNTEPDVLEGGEKSRLITQLMTDPNKKETIKHVVAAPAIKSPLVPLASIVKDADLMEKIKSLAARGFSPTALTNYIRNPIDFYKKHILHIDDSLEVDETITSRVFGTVVHNALEELHSPLIGQDLTPGTLTALIPKIRKVVRSHFGKLYSDTDIDKGKNYIAFNVLVRYLERLISMEIEAVQKNNIRILALEKEIKVRLDIAGLDFPVYLRGYIDRIDQYNDRIRIIDYKTGNVVPGNVEVSDWNTLLENPDKSKAFQLLAYAYMYSCEAGMETLEAGIISLKNLNSGLLRFATKEAGSRSKKDPVINNLVLARFKEVLDYLLREICTQDLPFTEKRP